MRGGGDSSTGQLSSPPSCPLSHLTIVMPHPPVLAFFSLVGFLSLTGAQQNFNTQFDEQQLIMGGSKWMKNKRGYFLSVCCRPLSLLSLSLHHMLFSRFSLLSPVWHAGSPLPLLSFSSPSLVGTFPGQRDGMEREQKEAEEKERAGGNKKRGGGALAQEQFSTFHMWSPLSRHLAQWHFIPSAQLGNSAVLARRNV